MLCQQLYCYSLRHAHFLYIIVFIFIIFNSSTLYISYRMLISISYSTYEMSKKTLQQCRFVHFRLGKENILHSNKSASTLPVAHVKEINMFEGFFFARIFSVFHLSLSLHMTCFFRGKGLFVLFLFCCFLPHYYSRHPDKLISRPHRSENLVKK